MPSIEVTVTDPVGLHARPAARFVRTAMRFSSDITVVRDDRRADAKSLVAVLQLEAGQGTRIQLEAEGEDADAALDALRQQLAEG